MCRNSKKLGYGRNPVSCTAQVTLLFFKPDAHPTFDGSSGGKFCRTRPSWGEVQSVRLATRRLAGQWWYWQALMHSMVAAAGPAPAHPPDRVRLRQHHPPGRALHRPRQPGPTAIRGSDARAGPSGRWVAYKSGLREARRCGVGYICHQVLVFSWERLDVRDQVQAIGSV